jgi:hypothetical protein
MIERKNIVPDDDADEQDQQGMSNEDLRFIDDIVQALKRRFPRLVIDVDLG